MPVGSSKGSPSLKSVISGSSKGSPSLKSVISGSSKGLGYKTGLQNLRCFSRAFCFALFNSFPAFGFVQIFPA